MAPSPGDRRLPDSEDSVRWFSTRALLRPSMPAGAGVTKSVDGGTTWTSASNGLPPDAVVAALAIEPSAPLTLYAGLAGGGPGVFKTTDGGRTWHPAGATALHPPIVALAPARRAGAAAAHPARGGPWAFRQGPWIGPP